MMLFGSCQCAFLVNIQIQRSLIINIILINFDSSPSTKIFDQWTLWIGIIILSLLVNPEDLRLEFFCFRL